MGIYLVKGSVVNGVKLKDLKDLRKRDKVN